MVIKEYKKYNAEEILNLYKQVGWSNYTNNPDMLRKAYSNSLLILAACIDKQIVGIIRVVGDGSSIIYVQDIVVLPDKQRQGVGGALLKEVLNRYANVYQKVLLTDNTEKTNEFYKKLGFLDVEIMQCKAYMLVTR